MSFVLLTCSVLPTFWKASSASAHLEPRCGAPTLIRFDTSAGCSVAYIVFMVPPREWPTRLIFGTMDVAR